MERSRNGNLPAPGGEIKASIMDLVSFTPYHDVNEILDLLLTSVKGILGNQLTGMYLFGSLAHGDFDEHSDIDVLFVTEADISDGMFDGLYKIHERIASLDSPWANQLEVSYIPRDAIRRYDPSHNSHPHIDRGPGEKLHIMKHDTDWMIQRYILRKRGITITGPDPKSLIAPVLPTDLRVAVSDMMHNWYRHFLDDRGRINSRGYQSYIVLTQCRILYTWEHGEIVSKPVAAEWAKQSLGREWAGLIDSAWSGRQTPNLEARPADIDGTLELIRYTLETVSKSKTATNQS
jgi:predicted nucleotidyltransferase